MGNSQSEIDANLDKIFGNKEEIHKLIKDGNWEEASKFCDHPTHEAVTTNQDWWWDQIRNVKSIDGEEGSMMNSTSFGNFAAGVVYGARFPERKDDIEHIKRLFN